MKWPYWAIGDEVESVVNFDSLPPDSPWFTCAICQAKGLRCVDCHAHECHETKKCLLHRA